MRSGTNIDVIKACDGADNGCVRDLAVRVSPKSGPVHGQNSVLAAVASR